MAPVCEVVVPTASQTEGEAHETLLSALTAAGTGWLVQVDPLVDPKITGVWLVLLSSPTASQSVAELQDTPLNW